MHSSSRTEAEKSVSPWEEKYQPMLERLKRRRKSKRRMKGGDDWSVTLHCCLCGKNFPETKTLEIHLNDCVKNLQRMKRDDVEEKLEQGKVNKDEVVEERISLNETETEENVKQGKVKKKLNKKSRRNTTKNEVDEGEEKVEQRKVKKKLKKKSRRNTIKNEADRDELDEGEEVVLKDYAYKQDNEKTYKDWEEEKEDLITQLKESIAVIKHDYKIMANVLGEDRAKEAYYDKMNYVVKGELLGDLKRFCLRRRKVAVAVAMAEDINVDVLFSENIIWELTISENIILELTNIEKMASCSITTTKKKIIEPQPSTDFSRRDRLMSRDFCDCSSEMELMSKPLVVAETSKLKYVSYFSCISCCKEWTATDDLRKKYEKSPSCRKMVEFCPSVMEKKQLKRIAWWEKYMKAKEEGSGKEKEKDKEKGLLVNVEDGVVNVEVFAELAELAALVEWRMANKEAPEKPYVSEDSSTSYGLDFLFGGYFGPGKLEARQRTPEEVKEAEQREAKKQEEIRVSIEEEEESMKQHDELVKLLGEERLSLIYSHETTANYRKKRKEEEAFSKMTGEERAKDREEQEELWKKYMIQLRESEGFDIYDFPRSFRSCSLPVVEDNDIANSYLAVTCQKGLDLYNALNARDYEFVKLLKVNRRVCAGSVFYITLQARRRSDDSLAVFQTRVFRQAGTKKYRIDFCRLKNGEN